MTSTATSVKEYHVLSSASRQQIMWVSLSSLLYFCHFSKTTGVCQEKEHGVPSLDRAPLPSHTRPVMPCTDLNLDLNPKTIQCYYYKNGMRCQSKENWANFNVKWVITHVFPELYLSFCLLEWDGSEVHTSAFITSLNPSSSLSRIFLYFSNSSAMISFFLFFKHMV